MNTKSTINDEIDFDDKKNQSKKINAIIANLPPANINPFPLSSNYINYNLTFSRQLVNEVRINFDYSFSGITNTGFVAHYASEGPDRLVWSETGRTEVTVPVISANNTTSLIFLNVSKITSARRYTMNSCVETAGEIPGGIYDLGFTFLPSNNIHLPSGSYRGVLPLYIQSWSYLYQVPVRINIFLN